MGLKNQLIGVDEVGRGPLAGPVCVCVLWIKKPLADWPKSDSKRVSKKERQRWFSMAEELKKEGRLDFALGFVSARKIDDIGISGAIKLAIKKCFQKLSPPSRVPIFLDGLLAAPERYLKQKTIIGGDAIVPVISLASIIAKVARDNLMQKKHLKDPRYGFNQNKGYGTKAHFSALKKYGPSKEHRLTFLGKIF